MQYAVFTAGGETMDWVKGVQQAIDYMEMHLTGELRLEEIAARSYSSPYHFQRVFSILCGITMSEYIRNRRLTLAGKELQETSEKVIDIALKYGYDSPDSFARAFARFHGITPSEARRKGAVLQAFSPLSVKIILEGGERMKYRLEDKEAMTFIGHGYVCGWDGDPGENFESETSGCPPTQHLEQGLRYADRGKKRDTTMHWLGSRQEQNILKGIRPEENVWYDIYTDFTDEGFTHYIGVRRPENPAGIIPNAIRSNAAGEACDEADAMTMDAETFQIIHVPAGKYVIVESERKESPEEDYLELQRQIISQWLPTSGYMLSERPQINRVGMDPEPRKRYMEIWMPIE